MGFFYTVLRCNGRRKRRNIFQLVMQKQLFCCLGTVTFPPLSEMGEILSVIFLFIGDNTITNSCPLVTVHILVSKCVIGLCMTSDNMTLANFLSEPSRVDLTIFKKHSINVKHLDGWKRKWTGQEGSYWVFGHAGIHKQDRDKRKFWIIKALNKPFQ